MLLHTLFFGCSWRTKITIQLLIFITNSYKYTHARIHESQITGRRKNQQSIFAFCQPTIVGLDGRPELEQSSCECMWMWKHIVRNNRIRIIDRTKIRSSTNPFLFCMQCRKNSRARIRAGETHTHTYTDTAPAPPTTVRSSDGAAVRLRCEEEQQKRWFTWEKILQRRNCEYGMCLWSGLWCASRIGRCLFGSGATRHEARARSEDMNETSFKTVHCMTNWYLVEPLGTSSSKPIKDFSRHNDSAMGRWRHWHMSDWKCVSLYKIWFVWDFCGCDGFIT